MQINIESMVLALNERADKTGMTWSGTSDARNPGLLLRKPLQDIVARIRERARPAYIDLTGVEYMNSATSPVLIEFLRSLDTIGVPITLTYDPDQAYQRIAFGPFRALASVMKNVKVHRIGEPDR